MKQDEGPKREEQDDPSQGEFEKFAALTRRLLAVPKDEVDERVQKWKEGRRQQPRRPS